MVAMKRALLVLVLVLGGCGTTMRAGVGPTLTSDHRVGAELGVDLGEYLIAGTDVGEPIGLNATAAALSDGEMTVMLGMSVGLERFPKHGTGWRAGMVVGGMLGGDEEYGVMRFEAAMTRGAFVASENACHNEKGECFFDWRKTSVKQVGVAASWTGMWLPDEDDPDKHHFVDWRVSLAGFLEYSEITTAF
jgi:hypothetical protein